MAEKSKLPENALLAELINKGAEDALTFWGYIGPNENKDSIKLYQDLIDLSKCFEIEKKDIIHFVEAPTSFLPFGGVIIWLKKGSEIISRKTIETSQGAFNNSSSNIDQNTERRAGRLLMKVRNDNSTTSSCQSHCIGSSCHSRCFRQL